MKTVTVTEAARNFSDFVNRVHYLGESALLVKGGRPMVKVTPAKRVNTGDELAKKWSSLPHLSRKDAEEFDRDLKSARAALPPLKSKWD